VQLCKPYPEHCDRFSEVVRELRERDTQTKQAAREVTKRSLESGAPDDAIIVDNFCKKARVSNARPFKIVRTRDEVDMQWARAAVSAGLPMSFFDNKEVRKAVRMTAECGENYIRTKPGGVKDTTLPHRTYFTTKLIPKLDKFIDGKNMGKMREMAEELAAAVFSDGWTAVNHHPIVNIIMGVRSLHTLRASIDTMGEEKTMDFIAALIVQHIKEIGEGRVLCEHSWSIEGWIHSKRRNRLGQDLVERLVRTHTNLQLEHRLELYEAGMLPWDIEMTVEEPLSDDEDGVPHDVSDSESESENDSD
jgi:hypothetical protein